MAADARAKLIEARCRLLTKEAWYGHIAMQMRWSPSNMDWLPEHRRTMGVKILADGMVECIYYEPFVMSHTLKQLYGVVMHEIEHVVRLHLVRVGGRNPLGWNIAADMCVNGKEDRPRCCYRDDEIIVLPTDGMIHIPPDDKEWPETGTAESYYAKLEAMAKDGGFIIDKDGNIRAGKGEFGQTVDDHEIWRQTEISEDEARQIVKSICDNATAAAPGVVPGHLTEALESLSIPVIRWQQHLREVIGRHVGNKRSTFSRLNRRRQDFGVKGFSRHACGKGVIVADVSGSVQQRQFQMFFAEIDAVAHRLTPWLLQWDHAFQDFKRYRRGDWKGFQIKGRGGTDMEAPMKWLEDNGQIGDINIMFTDGEVSAWPERREYPMIFVIANSRDVVGPDWGVTIYLEKSSQRRKEEE